MDTAHSSSEDSSSTAATTPELSAAASNDDIWGSDNENNDNQTGTQQRSGEALLSDLPILKRQHMTDGYREGLGIGKAKIMQTGFDHGYPVGIRIGLRAGKILGVLEGIVAAKGVQSEVKLHVEKMLDRARQELLVVNLMKNLTDEQLMASTEIPANIQVVLQKWESTVIGGVCDKSGSEDL